MYPTDYGQPQNPPIPQSETQPPITQTQNTTERSAMPLPKTKKAWPLAMSWIAFLAATSSYLALTLGSYIVAKIYEPFSWQGVQILWLPQLQFILTFAIPVILILDFIGLLLICIKFPSKIRTALALSLSVIAGLPVVWLYFASKLKMLHCIIILSLVVLISIVFKIKSRKKEVYSNLLSSKTENANRVASVIFLIMLAIELGFAIYKAIDPASRLISYFVRQNQEAQYAESIADDSVISKELAKMVYSLCSGKFDIVYASSEDTGIFECKDSAEIYSVTDLKEEEINGRGQAAASFIGFSYNKIVTEYFPEAKYIYDDTYYRETTLRLLVEEDSEEEIVEKYSKPIYEFVNDEEMKPNQQIEIAIFYNNNLDTVKDIHDYILISAAAGIHGVLPHAQITENYIYQYDEMSAMHELAENRNLYSSQTRNAIKFNRHAILVIDSEELDTLTENQVRTLLEESFVEGL